MHTPRDFSRKAAEATTNLQLRGALQRASAHFREERQRGLSLLPEAQAMLQRARQARLKSLENMPQLLELLERNLKSRGVQVHWAATSGEACGIIARLAAQYGVRRVVKGKSMITEEIGLNPVLEERGIEVVETDLGEYIIQLAGEPPSHIIAPAVHKTRRDVAELFLDKLGKTADDSVALTGIAREALRAKFLHADMGITGANMAVADPGAILLVENEGNIRLSTTCPRVHVAVMSLEKVIAGVDEMEAVLQMLPRNATGQKLSSYVSIFSSARLPDESDGPEAMHVVILDNGRSRIMADPALRETLLCVRCGACLAACPVYRSIGGHSYGWAYSGPIGSLLGPQLLPHADAGDFPAACTMCGNCRDVCPVGIDHPAMLLEMRRRYAEDPEWGSPPSALEQWGHDAYCYAATHSWAYRTGVTAMRALDPEFRFARRFSGTLARYAKGRALPKLRTPFAALWRKRKEQRNG